MQQIFNAGRVRRWHKHPVLSATADYNDGHQGRVARILLALHPKPSAALLAAALTHDDGEAGPGDIDGATKRSLPALLEMVESLEAEKYYELWNIGPIAHNLNKSDAEWLHFADKLDAYMWMMHHAPAVGKDDGWPKQREWLVAFSIRYGVVDQLQGVL